MNNPGPHHSGTSDGALQVDLAWREEAEGMGAVEEHLLLALPKLRELSGGIGGRGQAI